MNKLYITLLIGAMFFAGCQGKMNLLGKSEAQKVEAQGLANYDKRDINASKSIALFEAQKNAVSKISALFMGLSFLDGEDLLRETVLKNPQLYIKKYKITEAMKYGDYYRIKIKGHILANGIMTELQSRISTPKSQAKIMLVTNENYSSKAFSGEYARGSLVSTFDESGNFEFIDIPVLGEDFIINKPAALNMAANRGADILMIMEAAADKMNTAMTGFASVSAAISLKCFEVSSGNSISEVFLKANAIDVSGEKAAAKALASAGKMAAGQATLKIVKSLPQKKPLEVTLMFAEEFANVKKFSYILMSFDNVSDTRLQSWGDDVAIFNVYGQDLQGEEFASSILRNKFSLLNLENVASNEIVFSFMH